MRRWFTVAPGVEIEIELDSVIVESFREMSDGNPQQEIMGKIVGVTVTLGAIDGTPLATSEEQG
jgi:hypothetical protein